MTESQKQEKTESLLHTIVDGIQEVKGEEIVTLDLRHIPHAVASYFVVCHGNSSTQVAAIANSVQRETQKELGERPWQKEGMNNAEWVLLDYGDIVLHVFYRQAREFYGLEELWADAEVKKLDYIA